MNRNPRINDRQRAKFEQMSHEKEYDNFKRENEIKWECRHKMADAQHIIWTDNFLHSTKNIFAARVQVPFILKLIAIYLHRLTYSTNKIEISIALRMACLLMMPIEVHINKRHLALLSFFCLLICANLLKQSIRWNQNNIELDSERERGRGEERNFHNKNEKHEQNLYRSNT